MEAAACSQNGNIRWVHHRLYYFLQTTSTNFACRQGHYPTFAGVKRKAAITASAASTIVKSY